MLLASLNIQVLTSQTIIQKTKSGIYQEMQLSSRIHISILSKSDSDIETDKNKSHKKS